MKLFFTVADEFRGVRRDVVVDAGEQVSVGAFVEAIAPEDVGTTSWRAGDRTLTGDERLLDVVRDGITVAKGRSPGMEASFIGTKGFEVRVVGGPEAGRHWTLPPGTYSIGRSADADVPLTSDLQTSRRHATLTISDIGVFVRDEGSSNGVLLDGTHVSEAEVPEGSVMQVGESLVTWKHSGPQSVVAIADGEGGLTFNRPPRIIDSTEPVSVVMPGEPPEPQKSPFPLLAMLAPLVLGLVMVLVIPGHPIQYLAFTLMSPVMAVGNYLSTHKRGKGTYRDKVEDYERRLSESQLRISHAVERETEESRRSYPDPTEVSIAATTPSSRLWERRPRDDDFLVLRLGVTDRPASIRLEGHVAETDEPPVVHQVPATVALQEVGVLGIAGKRSSGEALARWLVAQAATFHAPDDLVVTVLTGPNQEGPWSWARWLPHMRPPGAGCVARIGNSDASIVRLAADLAGVVDDRLRHVDGPAFDRTAEPSHIVVLDGSYNLSSLPSLTRVLRFGPSVGVYAICVDDAERMLPEECRATAMFSETEPTRLGLRTSQGAPVAYVLADLVPSNWAEPVARAMAPLRLNRRSESVASLPKALRLLDLLRLDSLDPTAIGQIWGSPGRTTEALIGVTAAGNLVIDLSLDGPHGLVAGTTGSGKSEFLQSMIASLAVANRPNAMNFVLVDYKGGSAFKDCAQLPHTVGMVTDLDGHLTERALASLAAELRRRERILQTVGAKDIEDYWRVADGTDHQPLARLVLIIDEFASLVEELASFVEGLVDLARRGRSLGIHLVLATQRPSGVVSPAIKTNTNLRVAMRVTDAADSVDVIDSPLASRITKEAPGRGYLRVGHENLSEFQAARVGGRRVTGTETAYEFHIHPVSWLELGEQERVRREVTSTADETDLSGLVGAIRKATDLYQVPRSPSPWLAPLPDQYVIDHADDRSGRLRAPYALVDLPDEQAQRPATFDVERSGHLLFVGDAGSGRSTVLRTLAASIAMHCGGTDVHLFGIDCGNGALLPVDELVMCGAVIARGESDRADRLMTRLLDEVTRRQKVLSLGGFASIADQRIAVSAEDRLPYLVVLVDRWEGFVADYEAVDNGRLVGSFLHLMKEGASVGLRFIVSGDRSTLSARFTSLVSEIVVLRMNDRSNYSMAGLNPKKLPESILPGRGFRSAGGQELQVGLLTGDATGPAQVDAFRAVAREANRRDAAVPEHVLPVPIGVLPQTVLLGPMLGETSYRSGSGPHALVGVGGDRVEPVWVDLGRHGPGFVVAGPPGSGRSNALIVLARSLTKGGMSAIVVTTRMSPLRDLDRGGGVSAIVDGRTVSREEFHALVDGVQTPTVILVDDADQLGDTAINDVLIEFIRTARDCGNLLIVSGGAPELAGGFRGFIPEVRKSRSGLLLCPGAPNDGEVVGIRLQRTALFPGPVGRAQLVLAGETVVVQLPLDE